MQWALASTPHLGRWVSRGSWAPPGLTLNGLGTILNGLGITTTGQGTLF